MNKVDPLTALARQARLARAVGRAVDECLPPLTSVDPGLPISRPCKTKPISFPHSPAQRQVMETPRSGAAPAAQQRAFSPVRTVDRCSPQLTPVDAALPRSPACKTKPIADSPPATAPPALSPQQLAAARALARGQTVTRVAAELRVTRQALWKWRRVPAFNAEVARLHEVIARGEGGEG